MAIDKAFSETRPEERTRPGAAPGGGPGFPLGERLRKLRIEAGLTQSQLADGRFSKEYLSQIERGKTRPTGETLQWLAARLGVDPGYLETGVSAQERGRVETSLARAEALSEGHRYAEAVEEFARARLAAAGAFAPELELRCLLGESWA